MLLPSPISQAILGCRNAELWSSQGWWSSVGERSLQALEALAWEKQGCAGGGRLWMPGRCWCCHQEPRALPGPGLRLSCAMAECWHLPEPRGCGMPWQGC